MSEAYERAKQAAEAEEAAAEADDGKMGDGEGVSKNVGQRGHG